MAKQLEVKLGGAFKDGTLILYINGKRYVYIMDALYHKQIEKFLTSFVAKNGYKVPSRPGKALELINSMLADGTAEQIEPPPKSNLPPEFPDGCPHCKTPGYVQGIECPGCGIKEQLTFKKWIIREMAWATLPEKDAEELGFNFIDFRFEDYPEETEEDKQLKTQLATAWPPPFYAKFPSSNKFLWWDGKKYSVRIGFPSKTKALVLPEDWWDYAAVYVDNLLLKKPKGIRSQDAQTKVSPLM